MLGRGFGRILYGTVAASIALVLTGCAAAKLPGVGNSTPIPTQTPTPVITQTPTPTPTPIAIIMATPPAAKATPIPVSLTPIAQADDHLKTIGTKQEGENVYKVKLINSTSKGIVEVRMISMYTYEDEEYSYSRNLLTEGDVFADKEERILYYDTSYTATNEAGERHYHLLLGFEDGSVYTLTDVPFTDIVEAVIYYEDDVAYLVYLSQSSGQQVSTKEMELVHRDNRAAEEARRYDEEDYDEDEDYDEEDYDGEDHYDYDGGYDEEEYEYDRYDEEYNEE